MLLSLLGDTQRGLGKGSRDLNLNDYVSLDEIKYNTKN